MKTLEVKKLQAQKIINLCTILQNLIGIFSFNDSWTAFYRPYLATNRYLKKVREFGTVDSGDRPAEQAISFDNDATIADPLLTIVNLNAERYWINVFYNHDIELKNVQQIVFTPDWSLHKRRWPRPKGHHVAREPNDRADGRSRNVPFEDCYSRRTAVHHRQRRRSVDGRLPE